MKKITEFSAKWMRTIAEERGRNMEEAQLAVTESKSFSDVEALEVNLIDLRPDSLRNLISQINGRKVKLASGAEVILDTTGYETTRNGMSAIERFLHTISDPNIAYILLSLGTIGIIAEIYNPGTFFPGILGAISLLMAFYSLGVLDANLGGILLILLAFGLFIAIATITISIAAIFTFIISRIISAYRRQPSTGREELIGKTALVKAALAPEGIVLFKGERWTAESEAGRVEAGEEVIINKVDSLKLYVTKKQ
ncbi:MAG: hypothetical protein HYY80_01505 [Chloroflexi bacterium]|nr:hypothetical protein [Chloroflexota bacterium]